MPASSRAIVVGELDRRVVDGVRGYLERRAPGLAERVVRDAADEDGLLRR